jgi:hypothetical protein
MARPPKYHSEKERRAAIRAQNRARVKAWIAKHPRRWKAIIEKAKNKRKRASQPARSL